MIEVINTCLTFIALSVFEALLKKVCRSTYSVEMCDLVWENVVLIELKNILRILDPNLICYKLGFCSNFKIVLDPRKDYFNSQWNVKSNEDINLCFKELLMNNFFFYEASYLQVIQTSIIFLISL
eukprot:TRINITY_DN1859_c0_g1_i4.p2 TRINITY_DN1859_c0_g1~~TRINITY_DN1859_c0_g1_i4.p2  ORF type:complete len:125 (-),score=0.66 TRINITY_DN1859_c0_g1_i4:128-502(-)